MIAFAYEILVNSFNPALEHIWSLGVTAFQNYFTDPD